MKYQKGDVVRLKKSWIQLFNFTDRWYVVVTTSNEWGNTFYYLSDPSGLMTVTIHEIDRRYKWRL